MIRMKGLWLSMLAISAVITGINLNNIQVSAKAKGLSNTQVNAILTKSKLYRPSKIKPNQETTFDVFLKPKNESQYFQEALDVNTPGNSQFKHYLTPTEIGNKFGQSNSVITGWTSFLKKHGLKTTVSKNKRIIFVSGKAGSIGKLFKTNLNSAKYHHNPFQFGKVGPKFPKNLSKSLLAFVGMTDHSYNNAFPNTDLQLAETRPSIHKLGGYTNRFTKTYHLSSILKKGFNGKKNTVGIISFEGIHKSNAFHFWEHEHASISPARYTVKNVQGNFFNPKMISNDSGEATMDVEYAGSVAPQANIRMYRQKSGMPTFLNTVNLFNLAYDENKVSSLSSSWGLQSNRTNALMQKKGMLPKQYLDILSLTFAQGDIQGISTFSSSGDTGAGEYYVKQIKKNQAILGHSVHSNDIITTNPWLTSCGGTTLPYSYTGSELGNSTFGNISNKSERAWGSNLLNVLKNKPELLKKYPRIRMNLTTGGGGFSEIYATPNYQKGVPGVNTFNARKLLTKYNYPIFNAPLISGTGQGRNFPDVSANADSWTGYIIYQKEKGQSPWSVGAGTSIVGPQMAGAIADLNSGRSTRMGFLNAQIYQLATTQNSPFNPLNSTTDNNNMYYTGQPGTVYNQASGLGTVNFEKLFEEYK